MSEKRHIPFSIETFVKRSWPLLAIGAVLIVGLAAVLFHYAVVGRGRVPSPSSSTPPTASSTTPEALAIPRALDGLAVLPIEARLQPYAVMVENAPEARPLSGLAEANVVIEAPVEGGITRFMAIYDATTTAEQIGPVRSARPYFVELADALGAVYAHVGGSPEALTKISGLKSFRNLDEFFNAKYFWRSSKRSAPHNVYTRMDILREATAAKQWSTETFKAWQYLPETVTSSERGEVELVTIPYGGPFSVKWTYDKTTNRYTRSQASSLQKDADGALSSAVNVVVLLTEQQVLDEVGRLRIRTTGSGKARLYRDGKKFEGTWHRTAGEWLRFEAVDGSEMLFEPGTTWVSIVTSPSHFTLAP